MKKVVYKKVAKMQSGLDDKMEGYTVLPEEILDYEKENIRDFLIGANMIGPKSDQKQNDIKSY